MYLKDMYYTIHVDLHLAIFMVILRATCTCTLYCTDDLCMKLVSNLQAKVTGSTVRLLKWVTRSFPVSVIPHVQTIKESVDKEDVAAISEPF